MGTSAGPTLGGIITHAISWRWIFYINVPIGIIGIIATIRFLSEPVRLSGAKKQFDPIGAALLSLGMTLLMLGMSFGQEAGWSSPVIIGIFTAAVVLLVTFVLVERRVAHPIVDLSIFRNRLLSAALAQQLPQFHVAFCRHVSHAFLSGRVALFPAGPCRHGAHRSAAHHFGGGASERLALGSFRIAGAQPARTGCGLIRTVFSQQAHTTCAAVWHNLAAGLAGLGQALFQSPNNNAIMSSVPENRIGIASGFLATVRVLGQGFSVALGGAIFTSLGGARAGALLARNTAQPAAPLQDLFVHAFHVALMTCMVIASIGVFTALARGRSGPPANS